MEDFIFLVHLGATLYLVGVIWIVQILHYPLLENVGESGYAKYHNRHTSRITPVVAPAMITELLTAVYFVFVSLERINARYFWFGLALVLIIWISTFLVQVPLHEKLGASFDAGVQQRLVRTNWIRTAAWTLRGALILWMVWLKIK
jgi:hypothetical protein